MNTTLEPVTVSATLLSQMFLYLASKNVDAQAFLRSIGVDPALIESPDAYIPVETYLLIQDSAAEYINDPCFGLHMGEFAEAGSWSMLGYVMMNCKNLGEAFEKSARYSRLIGNMIEVRAELKFNKIKIIFFTPPTVPSMSRHCYESAFSSSLRMMRTLTGEDLHPLGVTFTHPQPESTAEYERVFACPVQFNQEANSYTIPLRFVNLPIRMANPALLEIFEKSAQELLTEIIGQKETARAAARIILSRMDDESLSINTVARELSVSVRTLQNRLEQDGVAFSELHKELRQKLACQYLRQNYSVEQITYLLGFSEPSVFRKAFKKWVGLTPREYRELPAAYLS